MNKKKTHTDLTSADSKAIGFDYQYYFFLWKLLSIQKGESVGLEVRDDVHCELDNDEQILYQVKHTIQTNAAGAPINLTDLDSDLWKTLSNWVKVITDKNDSRADETSQLAFLKKTTFVLASNKSHNKNNVMDLIHNFKIDSNESKARDGFNIILNSTTVDESKQYISTFLSLPSATFSLFLKKIEFELNVDDIIERCKSAILSDKISSHKIDHVFKSLDSSIKSDNFIKIKNGEKITITFDDFYSKYRRHYDLARNDSLIISSVDESLLNIDNLKDQKCIQQLIEIGDTEADDIEEISLYTKLKLQIKNSFESWIIAGELTSQEYLEFRDDAILQWRNLHKSKFRNITSDEPDSSSALAVLDSIREKTLTISGQNLNTRLSNGYFYELSDHPYIGWRKDWKKYIE